MEHLAGQAEIVAASGFTQDRQLPVREWPESSAVKKAPAPVGFDDDTAFYWRAGNHSMEPAGVASHDYVLVSPSASLVAPRRVWLKHRNGEEAIRYLVRAAPKVYEFIGWKGPDPKSDAYQKMFAEHLRRENVVDRGAVVAVYRARPSTTRPTPRAADWPPRRPADSLVSWSRHP